MRERAKEKSSTTNAADSDRGDQPSYRKPQVEERGKLRPHLVAGSGPPLPP